MMFIPNPTWQHLDAWLAGYEDRLSSVASNLSRKPLSIKQVQRADLIRFLLEVQETLTFELGQIHQQLLQNQPIRPMERVEYQRVLAREAGYVEREHPVVLRTSLLYPEVRLFVLTCQHGAAFIKKLRNQFVLASETERVPAAEIAEALQTWKQQVDAELEIQLHFLRHPLIGARSSF